MPSIIILNRIYPPEAGATGPMVRDLAEELVHRGWRVHVVAIGKNPSEAGTACVSGAGKWHFHSAGSVPGARTALGMARDLWRMWRCARRLPAADVVLSMTDPPGLAMLGHYLTRHFGPKSAHIHWAQDLYPHLMPVLGVRIPAFVQKRWKNWHRNCLNQSYRSVVIGRCMARVLLKDGVAKDVLTLIPNWPAGAGGPDPARYEGQNLRNICPEPWKFLYAGRLGRGHPYESFLRGAELMNGEQTNWPVRFTFLCDGPGAEDLARKRSEKGLEAIRVLPPQPPGSYRNLARQAAIHVVTLSHEAQGLMVPSKFYAALHFQRPVLFVGPENCEVAAMITEFDCGWVIDPGESPGEKAAGEKAGGEKLAELVRNLDSDPDLWVRKFRNAGIARQRLTRKKCLRLWAQLLADCVRGPGDFGNPRLPAPKPGKLKNARTDRRERNAA